MIYQPRPRTQNAYLKDGKPLVAKAPHLNGDYLPASLAAALELLGGIQKTIKPGDRVLIKPNFNCSFSLPLSTDLAMLSAVIEVLQDAGAKVVVGEMSGRADGPTDKVVSNLGVLPVLKRYGVPFINFERDQFIRLEVPGRYWTGFSIPRSIYEVEKRVYLANMRCHSSARFSASLKLSVGWINNDDRDRLHADKTQTEGKIADLNLSWQPDLVFIDGRRSTVAWHGRGDYVYPNLVMASGDMVAVDTEAVKILKNYPARNRIDVPLEEMEQLTVAQAHGLGSMDYLCLEAPARLRTEQEDIFDAAAEAVRPA